MKEKCKYCKQNHECYYLIMINSTRHLAYSCPNKSKKGKLIRVYLPMIEGLDLETQYTKKYLNSFGDPRALSLPGLFD